MRKGGATPTAVAPTSHCRSLVTCNGLTSAVCVVPDFVDLNFRDGRGSNATQLQVRDRSPYPRTNFRYVTRCG